jgi:hypothetical protein
MKKIGTLICLLIIVSAFIPVIAVAFAPKPDNDRPPLEKRVYIHYKKGHGKPDWVKDKKPPKDEGHSDHYALLGKGVEWPLGDLPLRYTINPTNDDGLSEEFIVAAVYTSAEEWDSHTYRELFYNYGDDPDGFDVDYTASFDWQVNDGTNELVFGDYPEYGVIAVAYTWGYFTGPPPSRKIVEFDIMFDTDYTWGDVTLNSALMDLQNIATHEIGHGIGLADIYNCDLETMYGYSVEGDIVKRDLYDGDIAGLQKLYK